MLELDSGLATLLGAVVAGLAAFSDLQTPGTGFALGTRLGVGKMVVAFSLRRQVHHLDQRAACTS